MLKSKKRDDIFMSCGTVVPYTLSHIVNKFALLCFLFLLCVLIGAVMEVLEEASGPV